MADDSSSSIGWFLAGLGLGALVGVLYAPRSGRETRESIINAANEGRDYATRTAQQVREQAGQWVDKGKETLNRQRDQFSQAIDAGRQAYREATEGGSKS